VNKLPGFCRVAILYVCSAVADRDALHGHDAICACRQRSARHDLYRFAALERECRLASRLHRLQHKLALPGRVRFEGHCNTVHHHTIERRLVAFGYDFLPKYAAGCQLQGQRFAARRLDGIQDGLACFGRRDHAFSRAMAR
jgi:hypothetical protein